MQGTGHTARSINLRDRVIEKLRMDDSIFVERYGIPFPTEYEWTRSQGRPAREIMRKEGVVMELAEYFRIADDILKENEERKNDPQVDMPSAFLQGGDDFQCPYCGREHSFEWNTDYGIPMVGRYVVQCLNDAGCNRTFKVDVETNTRYSV